VVPEGQKRKHELHRRCQALFTFDTILWRYPSALDWARQQPDKFFVVSATERRSGLDSRKPTKFHLSLGRRRRPRSEGEAGSLAEMQAGDVIIDEIKDFPLTTGLRSYVVQILRWYLAINFPCGLCYKSLFDAVLLKSR